MRIHPTVILALVVGCTSGNQRSCDDNSIVAMVEGEMRKHINKDVEPSFEWEIPESGMASTATDNIIIVEGYATYNGNNAARVKSRAVARVYCNGMDPIQVSLVTVHGLFNVPLLGTKDTMLNRSEEEARTEYLRYRIDSLHRAHKRDSLLREADSLMRAAGF